MQCAKILLEPAKFNALDKYIKSKWELGARSSDVATMGADRKRHLQNVVSILILKILAIAKGGQADAAGALSEALKSRSLAALVVQCETEAGAGPGRDWQKCSIVSNVIKSYKLALQCNRRADARQALNYLFFLRRRKRSTNR
jgi:hypothetical protein